MSPYGLAQNPYPNSPTPSTIDACILGGTRHKEARGSILSCIDDLRSKINEKANDKDFRLITLIQDVGSGKTHLALHIRGLKEIADKTTISYVDLSQISPCNLNSLYTAMLNGFTSEYINDLRKSIINFLKVKAERNIHNARKIFKYRTLDFLIGKSLDTKVEELLNNKIIPDSYALESVLKDEFSNVEISILKQIIEGKFKAGLYNVENLEDIIANLSALSILNLRFLQKLTIFQIDEFGSDKESLDFVKGVINAHLPSTILMLILTPSSYEEIRKQSISLFDRLEKANYKIDLAGSNTFHEIMEIVTEYIKYFDYEKKFTPENESDLIAKFKVIYDEFSDFRNIRSMINILYHSTEGAKKRNAEFIEEEDIDNTIKSVYPGLRIRGSIMDVPLSDFIKLRKSCSDFQTLESDIRNAVRDLVNYAHEVGTVAKPESINGKDKGIDLTYNDPYGTKVAVSVIINKDRTKSFEQISHTMKYLNSTDKLVVLTNASSTSGTNRTTFVNIDRCKIVDLIYFSSKYKNDEIVCDDSNRALMLAKSIKLC